MCRRVSYSFWLVFVMLCLVATTFSQSVPPVSFRVAPTYGAGSGPNSVGVGDFNGDGESDLAVANGGGNDVSILLGNGDGTFREEVNYPVGSNPVSLAVGDFNGDGKPDLAVANVFGNDLSVLLGNGDGTFQSAVSYAVGANPRSVAVGDFNGDGKPDLVAANLGSNDVSVLLGNGNGTFQMAVNYAAGSSPISIAVDDFNGDGRPDLAITNLSGNDVSVLLGNGNGIFQTAVNYAAGSGPYSVAVGDFNGDGRPDLAVANVGSNNLSVLLGNGNGTFQAAVNYAAGSGPNSVAVGDFNRDGQPDLVVTNSNGDGAYGNTVSVFLGNGDGTFQVAVSYLVGTGPVSVAVGDFKEDGKSDLAVANSNPGAPALGNISVLLGEGDGTFQAAVNYATGSGSSSVEVGDFNGDRKLDLAMLNSSGIGVFLGTGDGTFQAAVNYAAGANPGSVAVGDFNGDGKLDLAVTNSDLNSGVGSISVLLGTGDGTFQPPMSYAAGANPHSVMAGDFNGDSKLDLAMANSTDISVLLGNGDGSFQAPMNHAVGSGRPVSMAVGDFTGDSKLDLAVVKQFTTDPDTLSILLGNGDGSFQASMGFPAGSEPDDVAVGDFNGDGKLDLTVANSGGIGNSGSISILLGNGDGTFQEAAKYDSGTSPHALTVGDFNGDGKLDLALAVVLSGRDLGGPDVRVLLGNGDGTFQTATTFVAGSGDVTMGDFNGDGRPDLAVTNRENVRILINTSPGFPKEETLTTLTSSPNPSRLGQTVTFTATVTPSAGSGIPTGTVTFSDGASTIGSAMLNEAGQATLRITTLARGAHTITAVYSGDSNFKDSTSSTLTQTVRKAKTATALNSSPNPSTLGETVNFVATVTGQHGVVATGIVIFVEGKGKVLGVASLVNGSATLSPSTLPRGWHRVRAVYSGDDKSHGSTSPAITQKVLAKTGDEDASPI